MIERSVAQAMRDAVVAHCEANRGLIDSREFDAIAVAHGQLPKRRPGIGKKAREAYTQKRHRLRLAVNQALAEPDGLVLRLWSRQTKHAGAVHKLMDLDLSALADIKNQPVVQERTMRRHLKIARRALEAPTAMAASLPQPNSKLFLDHIEKDHQAAIEKAKRDFNYALAIAAVGRLPPELAVTKSLLP